jgi:hypothetical protein
MPPRRLLPPRRSPQRSLRLLVGLHIVCLLVACSVPVPIPAPVPELVRVPVPGNIVL